MIRIIILAILLAGCEPTDLDRARSEYVCSQRGGVYRFGDSDFKIRVSESDPKVGTPAICNNGASIDLPVIIPDSNFYPKAKP